MDIQPPVEGTPDERIGYTTALSQLCRRGPRNGWLAVAHGSVLAALRPRCRTRSRLPGIACRMLLGGERAGSLQGPTHSDTARCSGTTPASRGRPEGTGQGNHSGGSPGHVPAERHGWSRMDSARRDPGIGAGPGPGQQALEDGPDCRDTDP